jgi:tetratricopeptide (TPR) repeat protein
MHRKTPSPLVDGVGLDRVSASVTDALGGRAESARLPDVADNLRNPVPSQADPSPSPVNRYRYWAFITYTHKNRRFADWLHARLERFRIPARLQSRLAVDVPNRERLAPVFTDRAELAATHSLSEAIQTALDESRFLIVVASRASARSPRVDAEIEYFKKTGDCRRILTVIVDGHPNAALRGFSDEDECLPRTLRLSEGGQATARSLAGPLGADARGGFGQQRAALLRTIAGLLGVSYDALYRRHNRRRLITWFATLSGIAVVFAASSALISGWRIGRHGLESPQRPPLTVALRPLTFSDHTPANEFLAAAMDAELKRSLSTISGVRVTGTDREKSDIVLAGQLNDQKNVITLTVRTSDEGSGRTSARLFALTASRPLARWYELATDTAGALARQLNLTTISAEASSKSAPTDAEARSLYIEGRYLWLRNTARDLEAARSALRDSISLEPTFAPAWAALSRVYANQADSHLIDERVGYEDARVAALRAISLDPNLAAGHVALAHVYWGADWDWDGMDRELRQALRLNPRSAETLHIAGDLAKTLGRWQDAIELFGRARDLDPLQPSGSAIAGPLACAGRVDEAEQEWRRVASLDPGVGGAEYGLARLYLAMGRPESALEAINSEPEETWRRVMMPTVLYAVGRKREADAALAELERRVNEDSAAIYIAEAYVAARNPNAAILWLRKARDRRDSNLDFVKSDALLAPIAADPRYREILATMKLPLDGQCQIMHPRRVH